MDKMKKYFVERPTYNSMIHVCVGLGIAWLVSLAWGYSVVPLVLGIVFIVIGIAGHIYPLFAKPPK